MTIPELIARWRELAKRLLVEADEGADETIRGMCFATALRAETCADELEAITGGKP